MENGHKYDKDQQVLYSLFFNTIKLNSLTVNIHFMTET